MVDRLIELEPGLRRLLAPNPSPMTFNGTNTYIVGRGDVAVIDPGPNSEQHFESILSALAPGEQVTHIFVTHSHLDHSPLSVALSRRTGAPVHAFGTHEDGRSETMTRLAEAGQIGGGEGIDATFSPDVRLADGEVVRGSSWKIEALWTPGHIANHLCFAWNGAVFSGDHVMGWASSLISPPDGDLTAFMKSCRRLAQRTDRIYYPGHGDPVTAPASRLEWLIHHRMEREAQIISVLERGPATLRDITARIYTDTPPALLASAERNVLAHLIDLKEQKLISVEDFSNAPIALT